MSQFIFPPEQFAPPPGGGGGGEAVPEYLAPTLVIFTPGGKLSMLVYVAPCPEQVKNMYMSFFFIFLYHFNEFRSSISHRVRN